MFLVKKKDVCQVRGRIGNRYALTNTAEDQSHLEVSHGDFFPAHPAHTWVNLPFRTNTAEVIDLQKCAGEHLADHFVMVNTHDEPWLRVENELEEWYRVRFGSGKLLMQMVERRFCSQAYDLVRGSTAGSFSATRPEKVAF